MLPLAHSQLRVSDRAQAKMRHILEERGTSGQAVRLFAETNDEGDLELGLALDERRADDILVPADGIIVLADAGTLALARDRVIDYETQGFTFAKEDACVAPLFTE